MSIWIKIGAVAIAAAALFLGGYRFAAALYQSDIDELKAAHALALADKEKEARANERKQSEALSQAWEEVERQKAELVESRADSGSLRLELERVRNLADSYRARLSAASASSCKHFAERLDRCVGLLYEGSGLASEGAELSQRLSEKHDALARLHK
jgi:DNA repair exonuclease SbcCD ATPase subunit